MKIKSCAEVQNSVMKTDLQCQVNDVLENLRNANK